jgi:RHS repeat-associated protein
VCLVPCWGQLAKIPIAPYGEKYDGTSSDLDFTGQSQDALSNLYDFLYREYSPGQGRWISPDPAGLGAVDPSNPQSWNRHAYVANNPLSNVDPSGLQCVYITDQNGNTTLAEDGQNGVWRVAQPFFLPLLELWVPRSCVLCKGG